MMLEVKNVSASYGNIQALHDISLSVDEKTVITLIGSNGAGKSTLLKVLSGLMKPVNGSIFFRGKRIDGMTSDRILARGLSHCPEGRRVFSELTVTENLEMGAYLEHSSKEIRNRIEGIYESFPILKSRKNQMAGTMSGGEQQQLAIARALMMKPRMILFDEPSLGLAPILVDQVEDIILMLKEQGITILLVEQNANMALRVSNYAYVMETGKIVLHGPSSELRHNDQVVKAYLGG